MTCGRDEMKKYMQFRTEPRKLPIVLSVEDVSAVLAAAPGPGIKYRAALSIWYGAGLRASEVTNLKVRDIDSDRMLIHVERGKGGKDRDVMLSRSLLVLHERKTRLTVMTRLASKSAAETVTAITDILARLDPKLRRSMTFDNGGEFARHAMLKDAFDMATYFCDAYASWQKGGIENANGRIRRWLPRQTDLDDLTDEDIQDIAMSLNLTPRKCLGFKTPAEAFLSTLGKSLTIRFNAGVALRC